MNRTRRRIIFALILTTTFSSPIFCDNTSVDAAFDSLTDHLLKVYPETVTQLGTWPDAYIGKLVPSVPPHFGIGVSASGTFISTSAFTDAITAIINTIDESASGTTEKFTFSITEKIPIPAYSVNARLGGFFLPFDIGLYGSYLNFNKLSYNDFSGGIRYWSAGGDIRVALMKGNAVLPKLSLGAGYIFTRMNLHTAGSKAYIIGSDSYTARADTNVHFDMHTIFMQVQLSKKLLIFTPYVGARAVLNVANSGYDYSYAATRNNAIFIDETVSHTYTTPTWNFKNIQPQIYAGLGFSIFFFQLTAGGCWNPRNNLWSVNVNACFKM